jgi:hypothetical protein
MQSGIYPRKPCPEEVKRKISNTLKGRVFTEEWHRKQSESHKGKSPSPEQRKKLSDANKGIKRSLEERIKASCTKRGITREEFNGFAQYEDYCEKFNHPFKERVRIFFERKCVNCGKLERDCKHRLSVHHVEFDKSACCSNNKPLFVALCQSCHAKTNQNRNYWKEYYTNIINDKYNGICYISKEEYGRIKVKPLA